MGERKGVTGRGRGRRTEHAHAGLTPTKKRGAPGAPPLGFTTKARAKTSGAAGQVQAFGSFQRGAKVIDHRVHPHQGSFLVLG
jgi:hypothetical protein